MSRRTPVDVVPVLSPTGIATQGRPVCSVCGRGPAAVLTVRRHVGLVVLMRFAHVRAPFCRDHGIQVAKAYLRRTTIEGWWGILSVFINWFAVATDVGALRRARRLPFPRGAELTSGKAPAAGLPAEVVSVFNEPAEVRAARTSILRTVGLSIAFGVTVLVTTLLTNDSDASIARRLLIGSALTVLLYAVVSLLVGSQLDGRFVRPKLVEGPVGRAIGIGVATGLGAGIVVATFVSLLSGKLTSDPDMVAVFSERQWVAIGVIVFVAIIAAPLIEEMLFRGLLVESFRRRGRTSAILAGAVAFSLWHLNPAALRYYVLMGFLLGYLYWRLGLAGSISAHAVFNGVLVVLAFVTLAGGPSAITRAGIGLDLPRTWHIVEEEEEQLASSVDLAVESPAGSAFVIERFSASQLARQPIGSPLAALTHLPAGARSPQRVTVSGAPAVRFGIDLPGGTPAELVVVPRGNGIFVVTLVAGGSEEAERQFETMLASLRLPIA